MQDISHFTGPMSDYTKNRLSNAINPMNINQDPFIKNDPFVQNELEMWVPGYRRPKSNSVTHNTSRRQARYGQTTGQVNPEAAKTLLTMVGAGAIAVFVVVMVIVLGDLYTLYIADMFSASSTFNLGPLVATLAEIITNVTFTNIVTVVVSVFNSGPAMLAIATVTFLIIRKQYVKQINTLQRRTDIMDRYIDENIQRNNESQEVIQQASEAAPTPVADRIELQAANLSETSVENWDDYSIEDKVQICEAIEQGCRFGKTDLGKMKVDLVTGRIIKTTG